MRRLLWALPLLLALLVPEPCSASGQLVKYLMTKPQPPACAQAVVNYPPAFTSFAATDTAAYLWFYVTGASVGDVYSTEYYTPSGQLYPDTSGAFDPLNTGGSWCFVDLPFQIAGEMPATLPGTWTVRGLLNGTVIFTLQFSITPATTTCTYSLSPTPASATAAGGAGTASVTAPAGCAWSAASAVTWITTSSSGSGNGTINYTVAANTATTARSGTIAAGGQTLTINQAAATGGGTTPTAGNLLQNWDAETGPASPDYTGLKTIPGWVADGNATVYSYSGGGGYIDATMPGPVNRGKQFFGGGFAAASKIVQTIDLSGSAAAIDAGNQPYTLDAWLGGFAGQNDNALLRATFKSSTGATLGTGVVGPVMAADRNGNTSLIERTFTGKVPTGTRSADVSLELTRTDGSANDGYADNLYFGLTSSAGGGSGTSSLNLNINQVIDSACPSDRIIVSVTDASGKPVTGLTTSNFTLKEAGAARTITVSPVGAGSSAGPLSLTVLIDISGSISSTDLANEKAAAKQLVTQLGTTDQMSVYTFETNVKLIQDFTSDKTKLNSAIDGISGGNNTALYQAIQTASLAIGGRSGRKAIVLMTDGEDSGGGITIDQAIAAAQTAGAPVFSVGFGSSNQAVLTQIATQTGGFYSASATSTNLQSILQSIGQVISSQYEIDYTSLATTTDNQVDITVTYNGQTATASRTVLKCANSGTGTCTYFLQPQSLSVPAAGSTGTIIVSTQAGCTVSASANVAWIHIIGSSVGAVSYQVDANTGAARTGTIAIGNRTVPVNQDGGVSCTYSLTPNSNTIGALGGSSSVRLTTSAGCAWTAAATGSGWFHLTSAASGSGMANLAYTVDANTTTQQRSATVTVTGLAFTLTQQAGTPPSTPAIADNGIVNAASNRAGTIARGSFFTIYGANLGPSPYQQVQGYPIPDTMGGVVMTVSQGSYNKRAYLHFVSAPQINAILPSDAPLGNVQITVSYNGTVSSTSTATVVNTAFGVFSTASGPGPGIVQNYNSATDQPLNLQSYPLTPNQIAVLWGTGLGPITTPDNTPPAGGDLPVPVEIRVGGKLANRLYSGRAPSFAGVDNIYFSVPQDAPTGCSVPVQINAGGQVSNTVRVAISADGKKCQDVVAPFGTTLVSGAKQGTIGLMRVALSGTIDSSKPPVDSTFDVGFGTFSNTPAGGELAFSPFINLPPLGTCSSTNKLTDAGNVIASSGLSFDRTGSTPLDAGTELSVTGPRGTQKVQHFDPNANSGTYLTTIGGSAPVDGAPSLPAFLDPGSYTITGAGGKDVGVFTASLTVPTPVAWGNAAQITTLNRSAGVTLSWTGGDASQTVVIGGGSTDQKSKISGGFVCLVPAIAGTFTVPPTALADLPATGSVISSSDSMGVLFLAVGPMASPPTFSAPGLDAGRLFYSYITARAVPVQ